MSTTTIIVPDEKITMLMKAKSDLLTKELENEYMKENEDDLSTLNFFHEYLEIKNITVLERGFNGKEVGFCHGVNLHTGSKTFSDCKSEFFHNHISYLEKSNLNSSVLDKAKLEASLLC